MRHHDEAVAKYLRRVQPDPDHLGLVLTGSLARGTERADSDVDVYLIVSEPAWERALAAGRVAWSEPDRVGYEHGYIDVKLATEHYLDEVAVRGDDPVRDSFAHSVTVWARADGLAERVARAGRVPEGQWEERMASFIAQARLQGEYFLVQADQRGDRLLAHHAAVHLVLGCARALLALNRRLYQGPKYLTASLAALDRQPPGLAEAITTVLADPTAGHGARLLGLVEAFHDWPLSAEDTLSRFIVDHELAWRYGTQPPEYR